MKKNIEEIQKSHDAIVDGKHRARSAAKVLGLICAALIMAITQIQQCASDVNEFLSEPEDAADPVNPDADDGEDVSHEDIEH